MLNEFAEASGVSIALQENTLPIRNEVRGVCELLGLDPLYLANEGKLIVVVAPEHADQVLATMRQHPAGEHSVVIGEVQVSNPGKVLMTSVFGGKRLVDKLVGEQLPRIC